MLTKCPKHNINKKLTYVWFKIFITIIAPDIMSVTKETLPDIYTFCAGQCLCPAPAAYFQAWLPKSLSSV